jgi:hypothetical protein
MLVRTLVALLVGALAGAVTYVTQILRIPMNEEVQLWFLLSFALALALAYEVVVLLPLWVALHRFSVGRLLLPLLGSFAYGVLVAWLLRKEEDYALGMVFGLLLPVCITSVAFAVLVPRPVRA